MLVIKVNLSRVVVSKPARQLINFNTAKLRKSIYPTMVFSDFFSIFFEVPPAVVRNMPIRDHAATQPRGHICHIR
jgi:hypothetical protein